MGDDLGRVEFVVERRCEGESETWLVVRPDSACVPHYAALGLSVTPGTRVVIDAASRQPVGVLDQPPPVPASPAGYNPYFDLSPA